MALVNGTEGGPIPYEQAVRWIDNFRNNPPEGMLISSLYGKSRFESLINQPGCVGVRIYNARDDEGKNILVIFAVDADGNGLSGYILENGTLCPPVCNGKP